MSFEGQIICKNAPLTLIILDNFSDITHQGENLPGKLWIAAIEKNDTIYIS
jgi:hypothetical protein